MRWFQASLTAVVGLLAISVAAAQNQNLGQDQQQQQGQAGGPGQAGGNLNDMQIASWLSVGNHGEVAIGRLAEQHASNDQVKDMAHEMVKQHTEFGQQLMRFAGGMGAAGANQQGAGQQGGGQQAADQQAGTQQQGAGQPANQTLTSSITNQPGAGGQMGQGLNFVAVIQQMGQQCEQALSRELGEKQGAEFDKCYVGQQIGAHMEMLDKLQVLRRYASPQLQQVLAQGEQTTQHHLDQFKKLMKSLESKGS